MSTNYDTESGVIFPRLTQSQVNAISNPSTAQLVFNTTVSAYQYYNGSAWVNLVIGVSMPYDIAITVPTQPYPSTSLINMPMTRTVTLPAAFAGSLAVVAVPASSISTVLTVRVNGSSIGTITFAASSTNGVFAATYSGTLTMNPGDVFSITAPSPVDTTISNFGITIAATRPASSQ